MNIFGSKSGLQNNSKNRKIFFIFPTIFTIFDDFSKLCSTFGTLYIEKSSNTVESLEKMKKNLSIILLLNGGFGTKNVHSEWNVDKSSNLIFLLLQNHMVHHIGRGFLRHGNRVFQKLDLFSFQMSFT